MRVREAVVVEGRCDKAKLSALIEGTIVETGGFAIFNDRDKMELIRRLAAKRGVIILTDSDQFSFFESGLLRTMSGESLAERRTELSGTLDLVDELEKTGLAGIN